MCRRSPRTDSSGSAYPACTRSARRRRCRIHRSCRSVALLAQASSAEWTRGRPGPSLRQRSRCRCWSCIQAATSVPGRDSAGPQYRTPIVTVLGAPRRPSASLRRPRVQGSAPGKRPSRALGLKRTTHQVQLPRIRICPPQHFVRTLEAKRQSNTKIQNYLTKQLALTRVLRCGARQIYQWGNCSTQYGTTASNKSRRPVGFQLKSFLCYLSILPAYALVALGGALRLAVSTRRESRRRAPLSRTGEADWSSTGLLSISTRPSSRYRRSAAQGESWYALD